jgi:hypothetical protein
MSLEEHDALEGQEENSTKPTSTETDSSAQNSEPTSPADEQTPQEPEPTTTAVTPEITTTVADEVIAPEASEPEATEEIPMVTSADAPEATTTPEAEVSEIKAAEEVPLSISAPAAENPELMEEVYDLAKTAAEAPKSEEASADEDHVISAEDESDDDSDDSDSSEEVDYSLLRKEELGVALEKEVEALGASGISAGRFKKSDAMVKEIRPVFDQMKRNELESAKATFVAETGSEEGFEFKYDPETRRIEDLIKELRTKKNAYFQNPEKNKDQNFNVKTELLQRMRGLVDGDESHETGAADMKSSWEEFKKIQEEWKTAGNILSPHNGTLWATYNALIDRYFSNRNIYFELKELDRKRNAELKVELCDRVEALVKTLEDRSMSREILNEANHIFEDYKHIGPAPREEQEALWQRFKKSLDTMYDARRAQYEDQKKSMTDIYDKKSKTYETIVPYTTFSSGSINEWNGKTKEILAYQEEWVATKGPMPREEGKELSKKFWSALKTFFHNKGEFFKQLEARREQNLQAKTVLCEEVEKIVESAEDTPANTQRVIELQKKWKTIGQVPEKFKDSIYVRFKKSCDAYFENKRSKNKEVEKDFEENFTKKKNLCERIEAAAADPKDSTLAHLNTFKDEWSSVGFVPKKEMQSIQKRYIAAVNAYVSAIGKLSNKEKEQVVLESEVEMVKDGESSRGLYRKESDIRRKVSQLENDIALWQNNIEFFAKSKTSDKLKATFEEKINKASDLLEELKHQLTIIQEAI